MHPATLDRQLARPAIDDTFAEADLQGLPGPVRRYLAAAIAPGTPLATSARLRMAGRIRLRRWLAFRAKETLAPHEGFVWRAHVAGVITGHDAYAGGRGELRWRLLGIVPVMRASGPDVARSAAARAAAEAMWVPTALLPRFGVAWAAGSDRHITAAFQIGAVPVELHLTIDEHGRPETFVLMRWGDPEGTGAFGWHLFGGRLTAYGTFGGLTIPTEGRVGWFFRTERWRQGEFFRFRITDLRAEPPAATRAPDAGTR